MGLMVDMRFGNRVLSDLYLRLHNVSGTKSTAFYSITLFDEKAGAEVSLVSMEDRNFTFGIPRNMGLPAFDVSGNPWSQCYEDFKARYALGLLPWVSALRDEDAAVLPAPVAEPMAAEPTVEPTTVEPTSEQPAPPLPDVTEPEPPITDALVPDQDEGVAISDPADTPAEPAPAGGRVDVELAEIEDVELARTIVLQRLSAEAARRAGMTMDAYIRVARLAEIIADPDSTDEERRDAELEAAQFKERAEAGAPYELARQMKAAKVGSFVTIEQIRAYDIYEGWPT